MPSAALHESASGTFLTLPDSAGTLTPEAGGREWLACALAIRRHFDIVLLGRLDARNECSKAGNQNSTNWNLGMFMLGAVS